MSRRPSRPVPRIPALVLVALLAVGVVVAERGSSRTLPSFPTLTSAIDGPTVPGDDAVSVAWFCSEGSSTETGRATETILIANLATRPVDATVTVLRGPDHTPAVEHRQIPPLAQERVPVADLAEDDDPGVVVEVLGGPAIVEHELRANNDVAVGPCARAAARDWFFAGGTTVLGAQEWLTLFNPFGEDAIVDVSFLTTSGEESPGATESLAVPRRSRVSVAVHEQVLREEELAIAVHARIGRIVAERSLKFDGIDIRRGFAASLGVTGAALRWSFPVGDGQSGVTQSISIANFAATAAQVDVRVVVDGETALEPESVDVPGESVERVDLINRVPVGSTYTVDVRVTRGAPVVVEAFGTWAVPAVVTGVASTHGSATVARRWAFAVGRPDDASEAVISAVNVTNRPLTVQLYAYTAGDPNSPVSAPARAVGPGERAEFRLSEIGIRPDQVIVIEADGLIVVGRLILGAGISMSSGIPDP
ncbi:MAG: DUF5719 family protein [Acidimicrobiia bacterium]